ncbi:SDR family NAD(P)-dependent oxidoreductase [Ohessyouella blattaphilus]|uniref:NADP-dependent 3-hydroxy acid dehydrogenase YdfG n=1 Tax=Ohessyouella blattaphilus TaxID=2949333 RepID=A0ABT1EEZ8_9FIRM|nr:SDR family NAD(P)-dependent oxidoreductase [Ohessyouella blattaphilus]MCP1109263.1 SDR family NAD(P)-dependent oxidoreductase [Ohessyouella blattaphilus]MCR8562657.1 SDR family NAD(P)-dependent oxidoreductase [Ohessyouella blattaphilus]
MRIAIVTGASSGIGRDFVRNIPKVYRHLDEIWVFARREDRLLELQKELEKKKTVKLRLFTGDLMRDYIYERLAKELATNNADVRMLVNAAGFGKYGLIESLKEEDMLGMIDLNCQALTKMTLKVLPFMSKGSRIIQMASAAAFTPQPYFTVYAATKSYVKSFSFGLRNEVRKMKISVTCVCPGPVRTEFFGLAGEASKYTNPRMMTTSVHVVREALIGAIRRQAVITVGPYMKVSRVLAKFIPDGITAYGFQIFNKYNN